MTHETRLTITLTPRTALLALLMTLVLSAPLDLGSETMTMTTTYPSPIGIYRTLITTGGTAGNPGNTLLSRDAGKVGIGTGTTAPAGKLDVEGSGGVILNAGNVGIGTANPQALLHVAGSGTAQVDGTASINRLDGNLQIISTGTAGQACSPNGRLAQDGATGALLYCQNNIWQTPSGASGGAPTFVAPIALGGIPSAWKKFDISSYNMGNPAALLLYVYWSSGYCENCGGSVYANSSASDTNELYLLTQYGGGKDTSNDNIGAQAIVPVAAGKFMYLKADPGYSAMIVGYFGASGSGSGGSGGQVSGGSYGFCDVGTPSGGDDQTGCALAIAPAFCALDSGTKQMGCECPNGYTNVVLTNSPTWRHACLKN